MNSNSGVADINKVNASDMNEIKNTINGVDSGTDIVNNLVVGSVKTKNMFDKNTAIDGYTFDSNGNLLADSNYFYQNDYVIVEPNTTYVINNDNRTATYRVCEYNSSKTYIRRNYNITTFTTTSNTAYVRVSSLKTNLSTTQLEKGSTATAFTSYQNLNPTISDTGWIDLTLLNGCTQRTGDLYKPQFRRIGNVVYLKGQVSIPSHSGYLIMAILPNGFKPYFEGKLPELSTNNWVDTAGNIYISADNTARTNQNIQTWWTIN